MDETLHRDLSQSAEAAVGHLLEWVETHEEASLADCEAAVLALTHALSTDLLQSAVVSLSRRYSDECPVCGRQATRAVVRQRVRKILTACGYVQFPNPLYTCGHCRQSWKPLEFTIQLPAHARMSTTLRAWLGRLGQELSFRSAADLMRAFTGLAVGAETVRRCAADAPRGIVLPLIRRVWDRPSPRLVSLGSSRRVYDVPAKPSQPAS